MDEMDVQVIEDVQDSTVEEAYADIEGAQINWKLIGAAAVAAGAAIGAAVKNRSKIGDWATEKRRAHLKKVAAKHAKKAADIEAKLAEPEIVEETEEKEA